MLDSLYALWAYYYPTTLYSLAVVENFLVSVRCIHNCVGGVEICQLVSHLVRPLLCSKHALWSKSTKRKTIKGKTIIHTNVRPEIRSSLDLDGQILIYLANDLYRVANSEMRVLYIVSICSFHPALHISLSRSAIFPNGDRFVGVKMCWKENLPYSR